jgi:hypothetical protein
VNLLLLMHLRLHLRLRLLLLRRRLLRDLLLDRRRLRGHHHALAGPDRHELHADLHRLHDHATAGHHCLRSHHGHARHAAGRHEHHLHPASLRLLHHRHRLLELLLARLLRDKVNRRHVELEVRVRILPVAELGLIEIHLGLHPSRRHELDSICRELRVHVSHVGHRPVKRRKGPRCSSSAREGRCA